MKNRLSISEAEEKISFLKDKKIQSFYAASVQLTKTEKKELEDYFSKQTGYKIEVRRCPRGFYDVIIQFPLDK